MKDISQIINLFKSQKPFAKLNNRKVFDKFLELLPQNITNGVDFLFVKNGILFIVLKHQIFKVECQYNKATIKNLLTMIPDTSHYVFLAIGQNPQNKSEINTKHFPLKFSLQVSLSHSHSKEAQTRNQKNPQPEISNPKPAIRNKSQY